MKAFPMFLQMQGRRVVIAGGGEQAAQKCRLILKTEATIRMLAPVLDPELADLHAQGKIEWHSSPITAPDFANTALVFIATGSRAADASLQVLAKSAGAIVNVVDQPHLCDALTPSIVDRSPVVVAIGTEGTAPVLARQIKTRIEEMLEPRLGDLAALAGRLRARAAMHLAPRERRDLWRWVFAGPVRAKHARGAERAAAEMIKSAIDNKSFGAQLAGSVSLVGTGPGAIDLMTLRGIQRLQEADVIYFDAKVDAGILDLARRDAERVSVNAADGPHAFAENKLAGILVAEVNRGRRVVHLVEGDPASFARGSRELETLMANGLDCEVVPAIASSSTTQERPAKLCRAV
ncbi:siroheme synthase [Planktotalea sp.]|uniref:siroheme synthase family protein n=1 Tax=Planktotalea sp. TaxID=2029877 RepID=UPI003D69FFC2